MGSVYVSLTFAGAPQSYVNVWLRESVRVRESGRELCVCNFFIQYRGLHGPYQELSDAKLLVFGYSLMLKSLVIQRCWAVTEIQFFS